MPTTTNFGWTTPADTDLVKDGAAAIRTLGNGIDASLLDLKGGTTGQVLAKASNTDLDFTWTAGGDITEVVAGTGLSGGGTTGSVTLTNTVATAFDAAGDLVYGTGADTFTKLGIGTAGQVLTVNSGATAPEWKTSASGTSWTLVNAGGTAMTGAATITVSGISNADKILILVQNASSASAASELGIRFNGDTASNYNSYGFYVESASTYAAGNSQQLYANDSYLYCGKMSGSAGSIVSIGAMFNGCNSSGIKAGTITGGANAASSNGHYQYALHGFWSGSSTVSSVSIRSSVGNFDTGTLFVYTSA